MTKSLKQKQIVDNKKAGKSGRQTEGQLRKHFAEQYRFGFAPVRRGGRVKGSRRTVWLWVEGDVIDQVQADAIERGVKVSDWWEAAARFTLLEGSRTLK